MVDEYREKKRQLAKEFIPRWKEHRDACFINMMHCQDDLAALRRKRQKAYVNKPNWYKKFVLSWWPYYPDTKHYKQSRKTWLELIATYRRMVHFANAQIERLEQV